MCAFSFSGVASAAPLVKILEKGTFTGSVLLLNAPGPCFDGTFTFNSGDEEVTGYDLFDTTDPDPGFSSLSNCSAPGADGNPPGKFTFTGNVSTGGSEVIGEVHGFCTGSDLTDDPPGCNVGDTKECNMNLVFDCAGCGLAPALPLGYTLPEMQTNGTTSTKISPINCISSGDFTFTALFTDDAEEDAVPEAATTPGNLVADPATTDGGVDYSITVPAGGAGDLSVEYVTIPGVEWADGNNDPPTPVFVFPSEPTQVWDFEFTGTLDSIELTLG